MSQRHNLAITTISVPPGLLEKARTKATLTFRSFSQYMCFLICEDLAKDLEHPPESKKVLDWANVMSEPPAAGKEHKPH